MKFLNYLFRRAGGGFQKEYNQKRGEDGTYYVSFAEFKKLQAKIRALLAFVVIFFVVIMLIIFTDFPSRLMESAA